MYAHNVAKITNRRHHLAAITTAPNNISLTKLDSYVGYTEELIKLCARISDIPFLGNDSLSIGLEVHSMYPLPLNNCMVRILTAMQRRSSSKNNPKIKILHNPQRNNTGNPPPSPNSRSLFPRCDLYIPPLDNRTNNPEIIHS